MRRWALALRLLLLLPFALPGASAWADTVKLGLVGSTTGPHSGFDLPANEGVRMAVAELNGKGGIKVGGKSYTFQLVEEDAQSKPDFAASAAQRVLQDDDVHVVFGILTSGPGMAAATAFQRAKVLYVGGFTLMDTLLGKPGAELMFRALDADAVVAKPFIQASLQALPIKSIAIVLPNEDVSHEIANLYKPLLESAGVKVVATEFFQPDTTDYAPVLRKFQNQGIDGMLIGTTDPQAEAIVRQSVELGNLPRVFLYRGGSSAPALKYAHDITGFTWQILTRDLQASDDPSLADWKRRYEAFTHKQVSSQTYWALTFYDAVFMVADAMQKVGSVTDVKAIAAQLKGPRYQGVRTVGFDRDGRALSDFDVGILRDGKVSVVRATVQ